MLETEKQLQTKAACKGEPHSVSFTCRCVSERVCQIQAVACILQLSLIPLIQTEREGEAVLEVIMDGLHFCLYFLLLIILWDIDTLKERKFSYLQVPKIAPSPSTLSISVSCPMWGPRRSFPHVSQANAMTRERGKEREEEGQGMGRRHD